MLGWLEVRQTARILPSEETLDRPGPTPTFLWRAAALLAGAGVAQGNHISGVGHIRALYSGSHQRRWLPEPVSLSAAVPHNRSVFEVRRRVGRA